MTDEKKYTVRAVAPGGIQTKKARRIQAKMQNDPEIVGESLEPAPHPARTPDPFNDVIKPHGAPGKQSPGGPAAHTQTPPELRAPGRPRTRTMEWGALDYDRVKEWSERLRRGRHDIAYFIEQFLYIINKQGQFVPFKLWSEQRKIVEAAQRQYNAGKPIRLWIVKPRQIGSSTVCAAIVFWLAVFHDTYNCRVVAHKKDASSNIFKHIRRFRDNFPFECMLLPGEKSKTAVSFDTELLLRLVKGDIPAIDSDKPPKANIATASRIGIEVVSEAMGRSDTVQVLWCSEFAHWVRGGKDLAPDAFGAAMQTIPTAPETAIIIESTANGTGGMFHDGYWRAKRGDSDFEAVFFPWYEHAEYYLSPTFTGGTTEITAEALEKYDEDEKMLAAIPGIKRGHILWRAWAIPEKCHNDPDFFKQEYPATDKEAFIVRGVHVFDPHSLELIEQAHKATPAKIVGDFLLLAKAPTAMVRGPLTIWEFPNAKDTYVVGADVAQGVRQGDYSVAYVRSLMTGRYVAKYRRRMDLDLFVNALYGLGHFYNTAKIGVEANPAGGGVYVNRKLLDPPDHGGLAYPNLFFTHHVATLGMEVTDRPGWYTHSENREMMIQTLTSAVKRGIIRLYDALDAQGGDFVSEARRFQRDEKTGKAQAVSGYDDCIMAACITEMVAARTGLKVEEEKQKQLPWIGKYIQKVMNAINAKPQDGLSESGLDDTLGVEY